LQIAADPVRSLLHADETEAAALPARSLEVESTAVVGDSQLHVLADSGKRDTELARPAMYVAHIVVEIPGDGRACCLLRADEASGELSNPFITLAKLCVRTAEMLLGHVSARHGCAYDQSDDAGDSQKRLYQQQRVID
jgi:hypothetical protein